MSVENQLIGLVGYVPKILTNEVALALDLREECDIDSNIVWGDIEYLKKFGFDEFQIEEVDLSANKIEWPVVLLNADEIINKDVDENGLSYDDVMVYERGLRRALDFTNTIRASTFYQNPMSVLNRFADFHHKDDESELHHAESVLMEYCGGSEILAGRILEQMSENIEAMGATYHPATYMDDYLNHGDAVELEDDNIEAVYDPDLSHEGVPVTESVIARQIFEQIIDEIVNNKSPYIPNKNFIIRTDQGGIEIKRHKIDDFLSAGQMMAIKGLEKHLDMILAKKDGEVLLKKRADLIKSSQRVIKPMTESFHLVM